MKDLGILIAAGVGLYIISKRNKKEKEPEKLDNNVPDTFEGPVIGGPGTTDDPVRYITANELTSGQISESEASQVSISSDQIEIIKLIFDFELQLNDFIKGELTNKQNYVEGTPNSLLTDIRNYTTELEGCINSGISALNSIIPGEVLAMQVVNIFNGVGQCAIEVREEVSYLAGDPETGDGILLQYLKPEAIIQFYEGIEEIFTNFINMHGGLPEPLGEPSY